MKPKKEKQGYSSAWKAEPFVSRLVACKFMLLVHECLSEAESRKVQKRIIKKFGKEGKK